MYSRLLHRIGASTYASLQSLIEIMYFSYLHLAAFELGALLLGSGSGLQDAPQAELPGKQQLFYRLYTCIHCRHKGVLFDVDQCK